MDRLLDAERRLRRLACSGRGIAGSLQTVVPCEPAYGECRYTVRCQRCRIVFELSTETQQPRLLQPDLTAWLSRLVCPACSRAGAEVVFRCDVPSRSCFSLVRRRSCKHKYPRQRSPTGYDAQGTLAAENALTGAGRVYDLSALPHVIFMDPQVASVGLTEAAARGRGRRVKTAILHLKDVPRALASPGHPGPL